MPTPFESAQLNLQLFDLRREPLLRKARDWFLLEFHPTSFDDYMKEMLGEKNSWMRMVVGRRRMELQQKPVARLPKKRFTAQVEQLKVQLRRFKRSRHDASERRKANVRRRERSARA